MRKCQHSEIAWYGVRIQFLFWYSKYEIQRLKSCRTGKKLLVATSEIHGWGVFVEEDCQKGDFITEYKGELISIEESDRRAKVYDKTNRTYMFTLNAEYVIDATKYGSKIRFINFLHQPNCSAKVLVVNGDHRIGIYARRFIEAGEELTLNYLTNDPTCH